MAKKKPPNHSSGMYRYRIRVRQPDGTTKQKVFYSNISVADAQRKAEEWQIGKQIVSRTGIVTSSIMVDPFDRWARKWLEAYKLGTVKEHTYNFTYRSIVEKYMIPYFGQTPIGAIKQVDLQKYLNEIKQPNGQPLAKSTIKKHILILQEIFDRAEENSLIPRSPAKNLSTPTTAPESEERPYWNIEAVEMAKGWAKAYVQPQTYQEGYNGAEGIVIILETGLRRSELCALQWADIKWNRALIHVHQAVVPTTGKMVLGGTKTKSSDRYIPVSEEFLDWLATLPKRSKYVIPGPDVSKPRSPNGWATATARIMEKLSSETGLAPLTPHELRHTYGTVLRERGVDIYTISRVMGHSSVSVTEGIYVHNDIEVLRQKMNLNLGKVRTG